MIGSHLYDSLHLAVMGWPAANLRDVSAMAGRVKANSTSNGGLARLNHQAKGQQCRCIRTDEGCDFAIERPLIEDTALQQGRVS